MEQTALGDAPRHSSHALLILDMISDFSFPGGSRLLGPALRAGANIARLKERAKRKGIPCIYVNDNAGHWNSDRRELVERCLSQSTRAAELVRLLEPAPDDYFVIKPRHSGFFATPLHTLLNLIEARALIMTGVTTHQCVLFTAVDAYMRDFELVVPRDCVAAISATDTKRALALFQGSLQARTTRGVAVKFAVRHHKPRRKIAPG